MFSRVRGWLENRKLARLPVTRAQWENAVSSWPVAARYKGSDRDRLFDLSRRFLVRKEFAAGGEFTLTDEMQLLVATMAAVPVFGLGLDWYDGWYTVILYEDTFVTPDGQMDEYGVVHNEGRVLAGEAWLQGPVILSWRDVTESGGEDGYNVVLHELAHKLDMRSAGPNGAPPLHAGMDGERWHRVFTNAWQALERSALDGEPLLDPYALEDAGEFFAVATESFFESPVHLNQVLPDLYQQLSLFYRQEPLAQR